ncbi:MAG: hypothetical protein PHV91_01960 [Bacteroidales bacterium]|jgi:hypothetical protein|nr:hypothetical protein [Bacteroidales bacterium]
MEGFLTFIFVFIIILWAVGRLFPYLLAWWLKRKFSRMGGTNPMSRDKSQRNYKEGDVIVEVEKKEKKVVGNNVGEYIDFEETNSK